MLRGRVRKQRRNKRADGDVEPYGRMRRFEELKKLFNFLFKVVVLRELSASEALN